MDAVARRLHDVALVRLDRLVQYRVVSGQRVAHGLRMLFPQPGRALEVGEQEGHGPRGQLHHPAPF